MKTKIPYLLLSLIAAGGVWLSQPASAPAQAAGDDPAVTAALADLVAQQTTLIENQAKIDEKLATLAEDVRQARLFAARGGRGK